MTVSTTKRPHGIRTTYKRTNFRSRLEARWAAFFDLIGWPWTYEPFDVDAGPTGYAPDFLIRGEASLLIEVGPCEYLSDFSAKAAKPLAAFPDATRNVLILGVDPLILDSTDVAHQRAGYLINDGTPGSWSSYGLWTRCRECAGIGVFHEDGWYRIQPCGHYEGDHFLGPVSADELFDAWAEAGNRVQWRR